MYGVLVLIFLVSLVYSGFMAVHNRKMRAVHLKNRLKEQYGKPPAERERDLERIALGWEAEEKRIPEPEKIDEITWNDLDMDHIFDRVNSCGSFAGEQILYAALHKLGTEENSRPLEEKICFFASEETEREAVLFLLHGLGRESDSYYLPVFVNNLSAFEIPHIEFYHFMRALLAVSILPAVVFLNPLYLMFTFFVALANLVVYSFQRFKYSSNLSMLRSVLGIVRVGMQLSDTEKFSYEERFGDLAGLTGLFKKSVLRMTKLQRREEGGISGDIMSMTNAYLFGITLGDFIQYNKLLKELEGKQKELLLLYKRIGEADMAIAVASFRESLPVWCRPDMTEDKELKMEEIYHPLIREPVRNSAVMGRGCIITGSNASGKSTFIKAVAVNIALAQSIHTCAAVRFSLPQTSLVTSMAVRDDVTSGESYYIKEIKYLNRIIKSVREDRFLVCVIDEILRGTNTGERIAASCAVLKYLAERNCIAVVASHDIELTELLKNSYDNFHFTEVIEEGGVRFSYQIGTGPATSRNAIRLLDYMGFPAEIIEEAAQQYEKYENTPVRLEN